MDALGELLGTLGRVATNHGGAGLELLEGLHQVADARDGHVLEGACGGAGHRLREPGAVALGQDDAGGPRRLGGAQDRAQVARVLDPVQDDEERGRVGGLDQVLEGQDRLLGDDGDDALVRDSARHPVKRLAHFEAQRDPEVGRAPDGRRRTSRSSA